MEQKRQQELAKLSAQFGPTKLHQMLMDDGYKLEVRHTASGNRQSATGAKSDYTIFRSVYPAYVLYRTACGRYGDEFEVVDTIITDCPVGVTAWQRNGCPSCGLTDEESRFVFADLLQPQHSAEAVTSILDELVEGLEGRD